MTKKRTIRLVCAVVVLAVAVAGFMFVGGVVFLASGLRGDDPPSDDAIRKMFALHSDSFHELRDLLLARPEECLSFGPVDGNHEPFIHSRPRMTERAYRRIFALLKKTGMLDVRLQRHFGRTEVEMSVNEGSLFGRCKSIVFFEGHRPKTVLATDNRAKRGNGNWVNYAYSLLGESGWYIHCIY